MIWKLVWEGEANSLAAASGGSWDKTYNLPVQGWGFSVKEVWASFVLLGRSGGATLKVSFDEGAEDLMDAYRPGSDVIHSGGSPVDLTVAPNSAIPWTLRGTGAQPPLPFIRPRMLVGSTVGASAEQWVRGRLYLGGRPW